MSFLLQLIFNFFHKVLQVRMLFHSGDNLGDDVIVARNDRIQIQAGTVAEFELKVAHSVVLCDLVGETNPRDIRDLVVVVFVVSVPVDLHIVYCQRAVSEVPGIAIICSQKQDGDEKSRSQIKRGGIGCASEQLSKNEEIEDSEDNEESPGNLHIGHMKVKLPHDEPGRIVYVISCETVSGY